MVEYQVKWSLEALSDLRAILEFYIERNGNAVFSRKLNSKINKSTNLIAKNPFIGLSTDINTVRVVVTGDYQIIYEIIEHTILIVMIWDNRRDPGDKVISDRTKK